MEVAAWMYSGGDQDAAAFAQFGIQPEDLGLQTEIEVYPENWQAVETFIGLSTQWRMGPAGPIGLDYNVLYRKLDRMNLTPERYEEMEAEVQIMERQALTTMAERRRR